MIFRRLIISLLIVASHDALAQKTIKTIDIINVSNLSLTVTYNVCHKEAVLQRMFRDSNNGQMQYVYGTPEINCVEKTTTFDGKNMSKNIVTVNADDQIKATKIGEKSVGNAEVYVFKVVSQFGEQDFIASEADAKKTREVETNGTLSRCYAVNSDNNGNAGNVVELDNKGTNKIYCHSSYQPN